MVYHLLDRLNEQGRKVMTLARRESQQFKHYYIGPEHILLAILEQQGGDGVYILRTAGLDLKKIRVDVESKLSTGHEIPSGLPDISPRAQKVIEFAIEEARFRKDPSVGSADLLIALLREHTGIPADVMRKHNFGLEQARAEVRKIADQNA